MSIWRKLCLSVGGILLGWGIATMMHANPDLWHYEKAKSTKGYDYWTNNAGAEILVIKIK